MNYDHKKIEEKWENVWEERGINSVDLVGAKHPFYNLMMFPYPSAEGLHVGNMYAFTGADVYGRFMKMRGFDVFEPIGLDGFGIHSENYALKVNKHPIEQAKISEKRFYKQLRRIGNIFDWKHTVETYDPNYYKWTQWIFLKLFKAGLVERKKAPVNFCPSCLTVLADEQVIDEKCERCTSKVEKKYLEQWFFKITKYAEKLLKNLETIDWSEKVKTAQKLWIGKSKGVEIEFRIMNQESRIKVFTTAHDTIFGATFMVLAPELASKYLQYVPDSKKEAIRKYIETSLGKSEQDRIGDKKVKTGVEMGFNLVNPFTKKEIPVFVADYVLMVYGTGAVMGVPGHDSRDHEFALKYNLPIVPVIKPADKIREPVVVEKDGFWDYEGIKEKYAEESVLFDSGILDGLTSGQARKKIEEEIVNKGIGKVVINYHLRDWLVSRQRYWGAPIPMVNCKECGWVPVPEENLPVLLPSVEDWRPKGTGRGPLAGVPSFVHTKCPKCGSDADRETDVCDTFLDSSWYFLRYPSVESQKSKVTLRLRSGQASQKYNLKVKSEELPWDEEITKKWLPVNIYIGGAEHSVLHLMYSRFVTMALHDLGYLEFEEPFTKFFAHGLIINEGVKMSKSRGNIVNPDEYIEKFGADALRTYLMFIGPFSEGGDFRNFGVAGVYRFLNRVWNWIINSKFQAPNSNEIQNSKIQKLIKGVTEDLEKLRYNTAIAKLMEFLNYALRRQGSGGCALGEVKTYLKLLAPFAPHMTDELHSMFDSSKSIHQEEWPRYDEKAIRDEEVVIVVQVNGKLRSKVKSQKSKVTQEEIELLARNDEKVKKYLEGGVKKTIFVPGKLVNFVV